MYIFHLFRFNSWFVLSFLFVLLVLIWDYKTKKQFLSQLSPDILVTPYLPIIGSVCLLKGINNRISFLEEMTKKMYSSSYIVYFLHKPFYITEDPDEFQALIPHYLERGIVYDYFADDVIQNSVINSKLPYWKKNRKIISKSFKQSQLNRFVPIFNDIIDNSIKFHPKESSTSLLDRIGKMFFITSYATLGNLTPEQAESFPLNAYNEIRHYNEIIYMRFLKPWLYPDFTYKLTKGKTYIDQICKQIKDLIKKDWDLVREKAEELEKEGIENFAINLEKANVEKEVILSEVTFIFVAAVETTTITLAMVLILLGMRPNIQDNVLQEVLEVVGEHEPVGHYHLPYLKYTAMVINETLRIFPPLPLISRTLSAGVQIGNKILPKDLDVIFNIFSAQRNEKYWKDPLKFNPDRFSPAESEKQHPFSFMPFSSGPKNCIGYKYANMILLTAVALTVRKYKIWSSYKSVEEIKINCYVSMHLEKDDKNLCTFISRKEDTE